MIDFGAALDRKYAMLEARNAPRQDPMQDLMVQRMRRNQDPMTGVGLQYREFAGLPTTFGAKTWGVDAAQRNNAAIAKKPYSSAMGEYDQEGIARAMFGMMGQRGDNILQAGMNGGGGGITAGLPTMGRPSSYAPTPWSSSFGPGMLPSFALLGGGL